MSHSNLTSGNATFSNGTSPSGEQFNTVSWQSAFWPVAACTLAVVMQNTGRVCSGHYRDSYALRSSPLICAVDTLMMIVKFIELLVLGCPFRVAARHVWYDRFSPEDGEVQNSIELFINEEDKYVSFDDPTILAKVFQANIHGQPPGSDSDKISRTTNTTTDAAIPVLADESSGEVIELGEMSGILHEDEYLMSGALHNEASTSGQSLNTNMTFTVLGDEDDGTVIDFGRLSEASPDGEDIADIPLDIMATLEDPDDCLPGPVNSPSAPVNTSLHHDDDLEAGDVHNFSESSPLTDANDLVPVHSGSSIDRTWRLTMVGFLLGALPQAIKIFGSSGITFTQALIGVQIVSFVVPELFRALSGTAGAVNLRPMPSVVSAKETIAHIQGFVLGFSIAISTFVCAVILSQLVFTKGFDDGGPGILRILVLTNLMLISPAITIGLCVVITALLHVPLQLKFMMSLLEALTPPKRFCEVCKTAKTRIQTKLFGLVAIPTTYADECSIVAIFYFFVVLITLVPTVYSNAWRKDYILSGENVELVSGLIWTALILPVLAMLIVYCVLFRILFVGSLSKYPRELFGLKGTLSEFISGAFISVHIFAIFACYAWSLYSSAGTHKPKWADMLG